MQKMEFSSFRDPSGVVFEENGGIYRQINKIYMPQYRKLMDCGLAQNLQKNGMLIRHWETDAPCISDEGALVIQAEKIPYVSYIYEWSFGQIKDAALLTLKMHRKALDAGMILKDASAYNIQFLHGSPVMIDTLSFDFYTAGEPWVAYGQFCRHFLAPLLLMCYTDLRLNRLMELFIDGIPWILPPLCFMVRAACLQNSIFAGMQNLFPNTLWMEELGNSALPRRRRFH
jgi:hypothetical protein